MVEVPMWVYDSAVYLAAAIAFCIVVGPLGYYLGLKDRERNAFRRGFLKGLKHKKASPFDGEV